MANRSLLLNIPVLSSDVAGKLDGEGLSYVELACASYRIPITWLCCFRSADLKIVKIPYESKDGKKRLLSLSIPSTAVGTAIKNLEDSLPLLEKITGSAEISLGYWQRALDGLQDLPFPYLTIDPVELIFMSDLKTGAASFSRCFSGKAASIPWLKKHSGYRDGYIPYSVSDVYGAQTDQLNDADRWSNVSALDAGYAIPESRIWYNEAPDKVVSGHAGLPASPLVLPMMPLRGKIIFPYASDRLAFIARPKFKRAVQTAMQCDGKILLLAQKDSKKNILGARDFYMTGTIANISAIYDEPDGGTAVIIEGLQRADVEVVVDDDDYFSATVIPVPVDCVDVGQASSMNQALLSHFAQYSKLCEQKMPSSFCGIECTGRLVDTIAAYSLREQDDKQDILELYPIVDRLDRLHKILQAKIDRFLNKF